jgi:ubiquinone/menaquinone biosynthesis C-methylase UbiE
MKIIKTFLRFFFYHLYHDMAWTYDAVSWTVSLGRWKDWVHAAASFIEGPNVLEIGFGPGHLHAGLHKRGLRAFGLDESMQMARQSSRRLNRSGWKPALTRGHAQDLPFACVFQNVIATFPTEFILEQHTIESIYRVLLPGGRLVILSTAWFGGKRFTERAAEWLFNVTRQNAAEEEIKNRFIAPFEQAGFEVKVELVEATRSTLMFILAKKP